MPASILRCSSAPAGGRHCRKGFLSGVSTTADILNRNADQHLTALVEGGESPLGKPRRLVVATSSTAFIDRSSMYRNSSGVQISLDENEFTRATERLVQSIECLRNKHEAFEPAHMSSSSPSSTLRKANSLGRGPLSAEDLERQNERLEAYKMVRKVEPELPPLSRVLDDSPAKLTFDATIIRRNASQEALLCWTPTARKERLKDQKERRCVRTNQVMSTKQDTEAALTKLWLHGLRRKQKQGEMALAARREVKQVASDEGQRFPSETWFALCAMFAFAHQAQKDLVLTKMPAQDRATIVDNTSSCVVARGRLRRSTTAMVQMMKISQMMQEDIKVAKRMNMFATMYSAKLRIQERRIRATMIHICLVEWLCPTNKSWTALRRFAKLIVRLQHWWRAVAHRLHEVRDRISQRWEKLEHAELARELSKAELQAKVAALGSPIAPVPVVAPVAPLSLPLIAKRRGGQGQAASRLSLDDRIQLEMLDEAVRVRFIEHELRARRYRLLPIIEMWQVEVQHWRSEVKDYEEWKAAHQALQGQSPPMLTFKWPPVRPSYIPCDVGPLGKQGDEDIISMIRRARCTHGRGWTEIPKRTLGHVPLVANRVERDLPLMGQSDSARPFGEVGDDDGLSSWGVDAPGLTGLRPGNSDEFVRLAAQC